VDAGSEGLPVRAAGAVQAALPPAAGLLARQPRVAAGLRAALHGIDLVARIMVVAALLGELAVVLTDVTIRYLFTQSLLWTEEASKLCLTTLAFLGGASAYRARHHTAIQ
jgi:Tripartite ATP-independent periplasmic transporters, DctQ component